MSRAARKLFRPSINVTSLKLNRKRLPRTGEPQVRQYLCRVNGQQPFNALDLDNHAAVHEQIQSEPALHADSFEHDGDGNFCLQLKTTLPEFVCHTRLVHALHQPRTETAMHFNRGPDDR